MRAMKSLSPEATEDSFGKPKNIIYQTKKHIIMSVLFKLYQDNRTTSLHKGKYYARALVTGVKDLDALSKEIAHSTTVTEADCLAVLKELSNVMIQKLQDGYRIDIPDIGSFKIGLRTKPAESAAEFNVAKNVTGYRLNFVPAFTIQGHGKGCKRVYEAFNGLQVEQSPFNNISKKTTSATPENPGA